MGRVVGGDLLRGHVEDGAVLACLAGQGLGHQKREVGRHSGQVILAKSTN